MNRTAEITRTTKETDIALRLCLDAGESDIQTGIGFFDHMLTAFAFHGGFGLSLRAEGDTQVDCHHTVEDVGIALGTAFARALGDRKGIARFGTAFVPMDEVLGFCSLDISGRGFLRFDAEFPAAMIGGYDASMTKEFMRGFAVNAGITLHLKCECGENAHHMAEALYKALGRALRAAVKIEGGEVPSTKGML